MTEVKRTTWGVAAAASAAVVLWQGLAMATAGEAEPVSVLALRYLFVAAGLIGLSASMFMLAKGASRQG